MQRVQSIFFRIFSKKTFHFTYFCISSEELLDFERKNFGMVIKFALNVSKGTVWIFFCLKITIVFSLVSDFEQYFLGVAAEVSRQVCQNYLCTVPEKSFEEKFFVWNYSILLNVFGPWAKRFWVFSKILSAGLSKMHFRCPEKFFGEFCSCRTQ